MSGKRVTRQALLAPQSRVCGRRRGQQGRLPVMAVLESGALVQVPAGNPSEEGSQVHGHVSALQAAWYRCSEVGVVFKVGVVVSNHTSVGRERGLTVGVAAAPRARGGQSELLLVAVEGLGQRPCSWGVTY